ncbi:hypothetical protein ABW19_dt0207496 [Dactylella cylindrospora]|nr:hypothetical protein ABW19_dt0207496 [Dactylella cylindrospora]
MHPFLLYLSLLAFPPSVIAKLQTETRVTFLPTTDRTVSISPSWSVSTILPTVHQSCPPDAPTICGNLCCQSGYRCTYDISEYPKLACSPEPYTVHLSTSVQYGSDSSTTSASAPSRTLTGTTSTSTSVTESHVINTTQPTSDTPESSNTALPSAAPDKMSTADAKNAQLSSGAIAGIAIGASLPTFISLGLFLAAKFQRNKSAVSTNGFTRFENSEKLDKLEKEVEAAGALATASTGTQEHMIVLGQEHMAIMRPDSMSIRRQEHAVPIGRHSSQDRRRLAAGTD